MTTSAGQFAPAWVCSAFSRTSLKPLLEPSSRSTGPYLRPQHLYSGTSRSAQGMGKSPSYRSRKRGRRQRNNPAQSVGTTGLLYCFHRQWESTQRRIALTTRRHLPQRTRTGPRHDKATKYPKNIKPCPYHPSRALSFSYQQHQQDHDDKSKEPAAIVAGPVKRTAANSAETAEQAITNNNENDRPQMTW